MSSHAEKKDILRAMIPSLLADRSLLSWKSNIMIHCIASNTIALLRSSSTYYYTLGKDRYLLEVLQNTLLTKNKTVSVPKAAQSFTTEVWSWISWFITLPPILLPSYDLLLYLRQRYLLEPLQNIIHTKSSLPVSCLWIRRSLKVLTFELYQIAQLLGHWSLWTRN